MIAIEITNQHGPAFLAEHVGQDRKGAGQHVAHVVEEQVAIDLHPPCFDVCRCRMFVGVAQVRCEGELFFMQGAPGHREAALAVRRPGLARALQFDDPVDFGQQFS